MELAITAEGAPDLTDSSCTPFSSCAELIPVIVAISGNLSLALAVS